MVILKDFKRLFLGKLFQGISISLLGSIILLILGLSRTVILVKSIEIDEFGLIVLLQNFFVILSLFLGVRLSETFFKFLPIFEKSDNAEAFKSIMQISCILCFISGISILCVSSFLAETIGKYFYKDLRIIDLIKVFALGACILPFNELINAALRYREKFTSLISIQLLGRALSVFLIFLYLHLSNEPKLYIIILGFVLEIYCVILIGLFITFLTYIDIFRSFRMNFSALSGYYKRLKSTFLNSYTSGALKLGSEEGGLFLLGLLGTTADAALWGIAKQVILPIRVLLQNIQKVISPEICKMFEFQKINKLKNFIKNYCIATTLAGVIFFFLCLLFADQFILKFFSAEFIAAKKIIIILLLAETLVLISVPFFSLSISMERLFERNLVTSLRFLYLLSALFISIDAIVLAYIYLLGVITSRLLNDLPLFAKLHQLK